MKDMPDRPSTSGQSNSPEVCLREIAAWQLLPENCNFLVELPKLQRGFVWEPSKIMDLWDSILRGFPIGSLMVSTIDPEATANGSAHVDRYWLLDGQQRATTIAIGFYNPWNPEAQDASMWRLKSIPILWLDLEAKPRDSDKMFFPYLATQSHPWGYNIDGGVISVPNRRTACDAMKLGVDYFTVALSDCFPWEAKLPLPVAILLEVANREGMENPTDFWTAVGNASANLPASWEAKFGKRMKGEAPAGVDVLLQRLRRVPGSRVHLNYLTSDAANNDSTTGEDNSLLFVRLNSGGVVLGGEELIFSLFKSAFPLAKDAVEDCASGFMAPSKLFGLLVRLANASTAPEKLSRPVSLRDFKKDIGNPDSPLRTALEDLVHKERAHAPCEAARLMDRARAILCGTEGNTPDFCLPQAAATRTVSASPDIFLALLYWLKQGGDVTLGSEEHQNLLGRFTALSWFLPGNAKAKQETLREWVVNAGNDAATGMWSVDCLRVLFIRKDLVVPVFPAPEQVESLLLGGVLNVENPDYQKIPNFAAAEFWQGYAFLPATDGETDATREQRIKSNLISFINVVRSNRNMLLFAQRGYIRKRFRSFGQWEITLKDTNCPWDWDHIYPSAYRLWDVNEVYRNWHNTIGNARIEGLSENRRDGSNAPTKKLGFEDAWKNSAVSESLWNEMKLLEGKDTDIKNPATAKQICSIVLKRLASIYEEWHRELRIGSLMEEIRSVESTCAEPNSHP